MGAMGAMGAAGTVLADFLGAQTAQADDEAVADDVNAIAPPSRPPTPPTP